MGAPRKPKTHQVRCFTAEWEAMQAEIHAAPEMETQASVIARWHGAAAERGAAVDGRDGRNIEHEMRGAPRGSEENIREYNDLNSKGGGNNEGSRHEERRKEAEEGREEGQEVAAPAAGDAPRGPGVRTTDRTAGTRAAGDALSEPVVLAIHEPREFETLPYHDDDYMVLYRYEPLRPIFIAVAHLKATPPRQEWICAVGPVPRRAP